jgi:hypothetical protein
MVHARYNSGEYHGHRLNFQQQRSNSSRYVLSTFKNSCGSDLHAVEAAISPHEPTMLHRRQPYSGTRPVSATGAAIAMLPAVGLRATGVNVTARANSDGNCMV